MCVCVLLRVPFLPTALSPRLDGSQRNLTKEAHLWCPHLGTHPFLSPKLAQYQPNSALFEFKDLFQVGFRGNHGLVYGNIPKPHPRGCPVEESPFGFPVDLHPTNPFECGTEGKSHSIALVCVWDLQPQRIGRFKAK